MAGKHSNRARQAAIGCPTLACRVAARTGHPPATVQAAVIQLWAAVAAHLAQGRPVHLRPLGTFWAAVPATARHRARLGFRASAPLARGLDRQLAQG